MVRLRPAVLCAVLLLLAACSSKPIATTQPGPGSSPPATPLPAAYTLRTDSEQGYSLAMPDAWDFVVRDSPTFDADLQAVTQHSPDLATYFQQSFAADGQVRMMAADSRSLATGFTANVQVMASDLGPVASAPGLDDLARAKVTLLSRQTAVGKPVKHVNDRLSGLPAVRFDYTLAGGAGTPLVRSYVAVVQRGGRSFEYELTMGALTDAAGTTFDNLSQFFTLFTPATRRPAPSAGASPGGSPSASATSQQ